MVVESGFYLSHMSEAVVLMIAGAVTNDLLAKGRRALFLPESSRLASTRIRGLTFWYSY